MRTIKLIMLGAVLALSVAQSNAQKSNWVQNLNFRFTVWEDGNSGKAAATVDDRAIVATLSGLSVTITNGSNVISITLPTFDKKAFLIRKQIVGDTNEGNVLYYVRVPGRTNVDYDVSPLFTHTIVAQTTFNNEKNIFEHNVEEWSFNDPTLSFSVQGFTQRKRGQLITGGGVVLFSLSADLAGTGVDSAVSANTLSSREACLSLAANWSDAPAAGGFCCRPSSEPGVVAGLPDATVVFRL